jgi:endonuclease YncB( thermonuclease family)
MYAIAAILAVLLSSAPALAAGAQPPPAQPMPRCAEDGDGGACVWGRAEGFDAGAIQVRGLHIVLAGITAPGRKDLCGARSAKEEFDCARPARKRMGELLAKGVACEILDVASGQLWGRCKVAEGDLARQLVSAGLARAAKDGPYAEAQKQAVAAKRGLWAEGMVLPRDWEAARRKSEDEE